MAADVTRRERRRRRLIGVVAVFALVAVTLLVGRASASTVARPTTAVIRAQTRAVVLASKARLLSLRIVPPIGSTRSG